LSNCSTFLIVQKEKNKNLFDGWPTIVFFWPDIPLNFGGRIIAIEKFISDNGKFRVYIAPDPS
jgi:hypothetical protein